MRVALIILLSAVLIAVVIGFVQFFTGADTGIRVPDVEGPQTEGGIYRSVDGGASFGQFALSAGDVDLSRVDVVELFEDPVHEGTWWLATFGSGLFVWDEQRYEEELEQQMGGNEDTGTEAASIPAWLPVWGQEAVLQDASVRALVRSGEAGVLVALDTERRGRIWKSTDAAGTFRETYSTADESVFINALAVSPIDPNIVLAGLSDGLLIASSDAGETWSSQTTFQDVFTSLVFAAGSDSVAYATLQRAGAMKSTDRGATWQELTRVRLDRDDPSPGQALSRFQGSKTVYTLAPHPQDANQLLLATAGGLLRSTDGGTHWEQLPVPLRPEALPVRAAAYDPGNPIVIHTTAGDGLYTSLDGGANWRVSRFTIRPALAHLAVSRGTGNLVLIGTTDE